MPARKAVPAQHVARIVHDLKTPLSAMHTAADLIAAEPLSTQQSKHLGTLQAAITALEQLTTSILQSPETETDGTPDHPEDILHPLILQQQLAYTVDLFAPQAERSGHTFIFRWSQSAMSAYRTQADELQRILAVLVDNASLYSNPGTITLSAHIKFSSHKPFVVATLTDQGPGLNSKQVACMDAPGGPKRRSDGHGLGLWSARQLACEHGGDLRLITNTPEKSCFELVLPIMELSEDRNPATSEESSHRAAKVPLEGTALLVDDNEANRTLLHAILSSFGLHVHTAHSGQHALDLLPHTPVDLMFLDLNMPGLSGLETLKKISDSDHQMPKAVFAITAGIPAEERPTILQQGFAQILEKPINPIALYGTVESALVRPA